MVGIDIVEIERFQGIKKSDFSSWNKVFKKQEWQYCFGKPLPAQHLAGIFAAKEAVMKAVGAPAMKRYTAICIEHREDGKPIAVLSVAGVSAVEISISHDKRNAVAIALTQ